MNLKDGYLIDEDHWEEVNKNKRNYWWIYIEELLDI